MNKTQTKHKEADGLVKVYNILKNVNRKRSGKIISEKNKHRLLDKHINNIIKTYKCNLSLNMMMLRRFDMTFHPLVCFQNPNSLWGDGILPEI